MNFRELSLQIVNYLVFLVLALLLAALQTSLWLQLFGWFAAPYFWLTILVFWVLYRSPIESIFMIYLISFVMAAFTARPFSHLLAANILTALGLIYAQKRVYWAGSTFYMLACGGGTILFFVVGLLLSWRYDPNPMKDPLLFSRLLSILLTMLVSLPLHWIYTAIDHLTNKDHPSEAGSGII